MNPMPKFYVRLSTFEGTYMSTPMHDCKKVHTVSHIKGGNIKNAQMNLQYMLSIASNLMMC